MLRHTMRIFSSVAGLVLCLGPVSAQEAIPPLPERPTVFEFATDGEWPPVLKGIENIKVFETELSASAVTAAFQSRANEIALGSPKMRRLLGKRFVFAGADLLDDSKSEDTRPLEQRSAKVTYYSYDRNVAVRAIVRQGEVTEASDLEGYQPPETAEEIVAASKIALNDARIAREIAELEVHGLLTEMQEGQAGAGDRLIYLSYEKPGSAVADYFALVNMTTGNVIDAGSVAGPQ